MFSDRIHKNQHKDPYEELAAMCGLGSVDPLPSPDDMESIYKEGNALVCRPEAMSTPASVSISTCVKARFFPIFKTLQMSKIECAK